MIFISFIIEIAVGAENYLSKELDSRINKPLKVNVGTALSDSSVRVM